MAGAEACGSRTIGLVAIAAEWCHSKGYSGGYLGADEPIWPSIVGSTVESGSAVLKIVLWAPETLPADGAGTLCRFS